MKPRNPLSGFKIPADVYDPESAQRRLLAREQGHRRVMDGWPDGCIVLVDSREKNAWKMPNSKRATVKTGDYTVERMEHIFTLEKKSAADLAATLHNAKRRARFVRELKRMEPMKYRAIIIECTMDQFVSNPPPKPPAQYHDYNPVKIWLTLIRLSVEHLIPLFPMNGRAQAQRACRHLLLENYRAHWREMTPDKGTK